MRLRRNLFGVALAGAASVALLATGCGSSSHTSTPPSSSSASSSPAGSVGSASSASSGAAAGTPIKVGLICSCSGSVGSSFTTVADAYLAWANAINASGGIDGHQVQVIDKNDNSNTATGVTAAQSLLSDKVVAIYDLAESDVAWSSSALKAQIPVVGTYASFPLNSLFFAPDTTQDATVPADIALAKQAGATRLGMLYCVELAACQEQIPGLKKAGAAAGVPVVYTAGVTLTATDFTAQCVAAKQANVNAFLPTGSPGNIETLATDCERQGFHPVYIGGGANWAPVMATEAGLKDRSWLSFEDYPYFDATNPQIKALDSAMDQYYPGVRTSPNAAAELMVTSWASGQLLKDAAHCRWAQPQRHAHFRHGPKGTVLTAR